MEKRGYVTPLCSCGRHMEENEDGWHCKTCKKVLTTSRKSGKITVDSKETKKGADEG